MMSRSFLVILLLAMSLFAQAETVTVVGEDDWYPYCADRGGKPEGLAADIVREAFKAAGVDVVFKVMPYARCMDETKKGAEVACFDTTWLPEYDENFIKTKSHLFEAEIAIYSSSTYSGKMGLKVSDLEGKTVGITNGYEYGAEFGANKKIKSDSAKSDILVLKKQAAGRTDFALLYSRVADFLLKENKKEFDGKIKRVGTVVVDKLFLSFSKKHKDGKKFADLFDKGMDAIKANGTYKKIEDNWATKLK